jgi:excisionase family DNA binding protein
MSKRVFDVERHFSPQELGERLGLHPVTIMRACRTGAIPSAVFIGRIWRISASAAEAWLNERRPHRSRA